MTASRDGRIVTFYSYKGGTGRTMALANTAWILAANGKRVLAVDWDLEAPGLHRFFHPFLDPSTLGATTGVIDLITEYAWAATSPVQRADDWHRDYARIQPHAVSLTPETLGWEFPQGGTLDFVSAGRQNREYSATVSTFDWDNFYDRLGGGHFFDALRDDMKANYDYVLIDSRTGLSDIADICTVHLPDVLVDCFTLSDQSIDGAASVARQISERYTGRPISIFPVPMRIDEGEKEKADAGRALARLKFDRLPRDLSGDELTAYWGAVEIPYRPYYAYEETLATFGDEAGLTNSLLSAFERLTSVITDQQITSMPPVGEEVRLRIRDAFTRRRPALPADLFLSYVAENRMWADWIESVLTRAGFRVVPRDVSAEREALEPVSAVAENATRTVVLLSSAYLKSQRAVSLWDRAVADDPGAARRQLLPLRVGDVRLSAPYIDRNPVDLFRLDEVHATTALLRALDRPVQLTDGVSPGPRFPGTVPRIWNAPRATPVSPAAPWSWSGCVTSSAVGWPSCCPSRRPCTDSVASARPKWRWSTCTASWPTTTWCGGYRPSRSTTWWPGSPSSPSASAPREATTWRPPPRRPSICCGAGSPRTAGCWSSTTRTTPNGSGATSRRAAPATSWSPPGTRHGPSTAMRCPSMSSCGRSPSSTSSAAPPG